MPRLREHSSIAGRYMDKVTAIANIVNYSDNLVLLKITAGGPMGPNKRFHFRIGMQ